MPFSLRTSWHRRQNRLTEILDLRKTSGLPLIDLTITNPTGCGFIYPEQDILSTLSNPHSLNYQPDPRGLLSAREAVAEYYNNKNTEVSPSNIFLTASTSDGYSLLLKLLCNAGDTILVPSPSYPLFEYLARVNDVQLQQYQLFYDYGWHIDIESLHQASLDTLKAIVIINPHNPTGTFLKRNEYDSIRNFVGKHNLALIVDEVFIDYPHNRDKEIIYTAGENDTLIFTLNGISKMCALPQMKLGWIVVNGEPVIVNEACERLEILCDTFLSVNTPVQLALPSFLQMRVPIQHQIRERTKNNFHWLVSQLTRNHFHPASSISYLETEGGWYALLRVPAIKTDEEWAIGLLETFGVYVHPGYFFDFEQEGILVLSLLTPEVTFQSGASKLIEYVESIQ